MTTPLKNPPHRRLTNLPSLRLALAETLRRVERGDMEPERGRVLVDGCQTLAAIVRETSKP